jgi:hypothetical protein
MAVALNIEIYYLDAKQATLRSENKGWSDRTWNGVSQWCDMSIYEFVLQ